MSIAFIRTVILYIAVMIALRIMGKRQIGEMQPFEIVVTLMISDLAVIPMQDSGAPLLRGIIPIFTLVVMEVLMSFVVLKSKKSRAMFVGRPSVVIRNGKPCMEELTNLRFSLEDLKEEVRKQGIKDIKDVDIAILETDGGFSVIEKKGGNT